MTDRELVKVMLNLAESYEEAIDILDEFHYEVEERIAIVDESGVGDAEDRVAYWKGFQGSLADLGTASPHFTNRYRVPR